MILPWEHCPIGGVFMVAKLKQIQAKSNPNDLNVIFGLKCKITIFGLSSNVKYKYECRFTIFGYSSIVKMGFLNDKYTIIGLSLNVKIGFLMSKCDFYDQFDSQNRIFNVKIRYSALVRMSK